MPGLTARDLARMTDVQEDFLYSTCSITRTTGWSHSGIGGPTPTETTDSDVACRFQPATLEERRTILGDMQSTEQIWVLTVKKTQTINPGDTVTFGGDDWTVAKVLQGHSWETARRVGCRRAAE